MKSKSKMIKVFVWSLVTIVLVLLPSLRRVAAQTATFVVNSTADTVDANPGDGVCADAFGNCTLRAAIMETNALPGADTIILPAGTYILTIPGVNEDLSATGDLDITSDLTITGAGANITTIDGGGIDRIFHIRGASTVYISGLTVTGGKTLTSSPGGGGVRNEGTLTLTNVTVRGNTADLGGGIFNDVGGALTINGSTISDNAATLNDNAAPFTSDGGGGIFSISLGAALTLNRSTISGNTALVGGGIWIYHGTLILNNSTVSGNLAKYGGGINTSNNSIIVRLTNSTISGNRSSNSAAFRTGENANTTLKNTIVAGNLGGDCEIALTNNVVNSLGHNLDSDGTCKLIHPTDLTSRENPLLGPLANNGGPTLTHALLPGSPAIDAGGLDCLPTDQRGVPRPQGAASDIGAYEVGTACTPPPPNMVAWWPLDETSGTIVTDIVGGHNGTAQPASIGAFAGPGPVTSAFWPQPTFQPGMVDTSLFFSGDRRIEVPSSTDLEPGTGDFTIDAWVIYAASGNGQLLTVARKALGNAGTATIAPLGYPGGIGYEMIIQDFSPGMGILSFTMQGAGQGNLGTGGPFITPNTWHHVAFTLQRTSTAATVTQYLDGASGSTLTTPWTYGNVANPWNLLIGGDGIDAGQIAVDELEIFNRALTQSEIQAIFNAGSAGKCKTVVSPNHPPIANAGPDQMVEATSPSGASVTLNGSGSSDPDGDPLTYNWTGPFGAVSGVSNTVTIPLGTYTVTLTVNDGHATATDTVDITVRDTTPPDTIINSAVDGNGAAVAGGGSTLSNSITFTFGGTDAVGVTGFQCRLDAAAYGSCSSPASKSALAIGSHTFQVRAFDAAGNVDPSPASFTWTVVTPAQAVQNLITIIGNMGLPGGVATSLNAPLSNINTNNQAAACNKLNAFINQVNAKVQNGQLTSVQASQLLQAANAIKASLGC